MQLGGNIVVSGSQPIGTRLNPKRWARKLSFINEFVFFLEIKNI